MSPNYDVIVVGAGSVGNPTALFLAEQHFKVLVIDKRSAPGQGENKAAIGGVRATHSDPAKILTAIESLKIFSSWKETYGTDIDWKKGGYSYPVYDKTLEKTLKSYLPIQQKYGLTIDWYSSDEIIEIIPGINSKGLIGGTYSPNDGQVSPLKMASSVYEEAHKLGVDYHFKEKVIEYIIENSEIQGVKTNVATYYAHQVIVATGADAKEHGKLLGIDLPVEPESHEAGISSQIEHFLNPLVVDMRQGTEGKTANFYFGQIKEGQIIFCYTPKLPFQGKNKENLSEFLPILASRMINLIPRFKNLLIRRIWRGLYPMTPDGVPIVCKLKEVKGVIVAVGMCGQGFMLGPGIAKNIVSIVQTGKPLIKQDIFNDFSLYRNFNKENEAFK